jgi:hypothetical protein
MYMGLYTVLSHFFGQVCPKSNLGTIIESNDSLFLSHLTC